MQSMVAGAPVYGEDLTAAERRKFGLTRDQLAFRQNERLSPSAQAAGIRAGDVIVGFQGKTLTMDAYAFQEHVPANFIVGEQVTVELIRDGQRIRLPLTLK